jgi:hypothetical protein
MRRLKYIKFYENFNDESQKKSKNIQKIIDSYLECALWTDGEELEEQEKKNNQETYKMDEENWDESEIKELINDPDINIHNFDEDSLIKTYLDIKKFLKIVEFAVDDIDESDIGNDLWLTRNHHGAGFWDRGYEESVAQILTKAAESLGSVSLYLDNEG